MDIFHLYLYFGLSIAVTFILFLVACTIACILCYRLRDRHHERRADVDKNAVQLQVKDFNSFFVIKSLFIFFQLEILKEKADNSNKKEDVSKKSSPLLSEPIPRPSFPRNPSFQTNPNLTPFGSTTSTMNPFTSPIASPVPPSTLNATTLSDIFRVFSEFSRPQINMYTTGDPPSSHVTPSIQDVTSTQPPST